MNDQLLSFFFVFPYITGDKTVLEELFFALKDKFIQQLDAFYTPATTTSYS